MIKTLIKINNWKIVKLIKKHSNKVTIKQSRIKMEILIVTWVVIKMNWILKKIIKINLTKKILLKK